MSLDDEINKIKSDYYRIVYNITFNADAAKWMGKVRIQRKDTNEIVKGGFRVFDKEKSLVEEQIIEKMDIVKTELFSLGVPFEWNNRGRLILVHYLQLRSKIAEYMISCDRVISREEDKKYFSEKYANFWLQIIEDTIEIARSIEVLSAQERVDMLIFPERIFHNPSDPWNLDEIDSRVGIIKFFLNKSEQEINTQKIQIKKLTGMFHQLEWDT
ncbi:MAG TPA: hypothetical protein PKY50_19920 [Candidatus Competibacter sp.]|nr:hypothetical protein [Candidatus Competibacter sp.]